MAVSPWKLRSTPKELADRWREIGVWDDTPLGEKIDRALQERHRQDFRVHSAVRPWAGTFGELRDRAANVAGALRKLGVGPGDAVAFQLPNWVEAAVTFWAATFLGAVVVPIVHFYGPKEVKYILRRTGVKVFVSAAQFGRNDYLAQLPSVVEGIDSLQVVAVVGVADGSLPEGTVAFDSFYSATPLVRPLHADPDAPALVAYTSGTTAEPKGVIHSHQTLGAELKQLGDMEATGGMPVLTGTPVGHAMGMLSGLLIPVLRGQPINLVDVWDPARVLALMLEYGLAAGSGATYFLTSLLEHPDRKPEHMPFLRYVGLGGSAVPSAVAERAASAGVSIVRMYGSTEHPSITGSHHQDDEDARLRTDGRPLLGVDIKLLDEDGRPVPAGEPGEIWSRGPDCFVGYTDPRLTAASFDDDGWYRTEDVGVLDSAGCLTITDRKKDIIIRGGENISAAEVEELMLRCVEGIAEVAVVSAPDARYGERPCALVRLSSGHRAPTLEEVRQALSDAGLGHQKLPEFVEVVDDFPRTSTGKIKKAELRRQLAARQ